MGSNDLTMILPGQTDSLVNIRNYSKLEYLKNFTKLRLEEELLVWSAWSLSDSWAEWIAQFTTERVTTRRIRQEFSDTSNSSGSDHSLWLFLLLGAIIACLLFLPLLICCLCAQRRWRQQKKEEKEEDAKKWSIFRGNRQTEDLLGNCSHGKPPPAFHYLPPSPPSSSSFIQFFLSCSWLRSSDSNKPEIVFEKPSDKILLQKKKKKERKDEN